MKMKMSLRAFLISLSLISCINSAAQPGLTIYTDIGSNNVSHGLFIKSSAIGQYKFGKNILEAGFQTNLKNYNKPGFSGYTINASRNFAIKRISLGIQGFYVSIISSEIIRESNLGGFVNMKLNHFEMTLGANFRTFAFRPGGISEYEIEKKSTKLHEVGNLMYSFTYNLKPGDNRWNAGLSVTNTDHYTINQETNPMFNLHGSYKLKSPIRVFAEAWYKIAGASNLEVNYFGFYMRTGLIWNIN
jgi:hypothetical protein